jgi:L-asparaginase
MQGRQLKSLLKFQEPNGNVLIVYTGGTFGMVKNATTNTLEPYDLEDLTRYFPDLNQLNINISIFQIANIMDSSNLNVEVWVELVKIIEQFYYDFDGFIVIHGTDTMAYSASALSFMLENLGKPVIFTGAQLPVSLIRSDARDNLISALEIATLRKDNKPIVREVAIYFNNILLRGNRAKKVESSHFDAFESPNYPILAETGINIDFEFENLLAPTPNKPYFYKKIDNRVAIVKLFPGLTENYLKSIFENNDIKGIVLESFGSGNAPSYDWFLDLVKNAIARNVLIYNTSQCVKGRVSPTRYETGRKLHDLGVVPASDITVEAAVTKLMFVLANIEGVETQRLFLRKGIIGELTEI